MSVSRMPLRGAHWVDQVALHAHSNPTGVALRFEGASVTWAQLHERVAHAARGFAERGVARGDRVAILMTNRPEFVEATLAANSVGAIAVPINFRLAPDEVAYVLRDSGATMIVTDSLLAPLAAAAAGQLAYPVHTVVVGSAAWFEPYEALRADDRGEKPSTSDDNTPRFQPTSPAAGPSAEPRTQVAVDERDTALIMYTSGTTGRPKGAMLSHLNLLMQALTCIQTSRLVESDSVNLIAVPLFHIAGVGNLPAAMLLGTTSVIMPSAPFDPGVTLAVVAAEGVTEMFLVPAQWQAVCAHPDATRLSGSLRTISWGAAPATVTLLEAMARTFPQVQIVSVFGQTEMSPITTSLPGADAVRKIGSVGRPVPTVAVRIVDELMNDVAPGEVGEIVYRGPSLMSGYWNNPEATAAAFEGGWFHSGDLVRADDEGFLYVVDRKKDMIISGGENIYSAEVENALAGHPGVADVVVIGAPHERWGETPVAIVVPADPARPPSLTELTEWLRDRLASYKKPTALILLDELPRNASGKVLKNDLRSKFGLLDDGL